MAWLIIDAHPIYISWQEFEDNHRRLLECAQAHETERRASPPREAPALIQGLATCGACGCRMTVRYHVRRGVPQPDYVCYDEGIRSATPMCQSPRDGRR